MVKCSVCYSLAGLVFVVYHGRDNTCTANGEMQVPDLGSSDMSAVGSTMHKLRQVEAEQPLSTTSYRTRV